MSKLTATSSYPPRKPLAPLRATEQHIDTSTPAGLAFLRMLGVFARFETAIRKERQLEGVAKAKANGVYKGRKPSVDVVAVRSMLLALATCQASWDR